MTAFSVRLEWRREASEADVERALEQLHYVGIEAVGSSGHRVSFRLTVEAKSARAAIDAACRTVPAALEYLDLQDDQLTRAEATDHDVLDEDLERPNFPDLVGVSEIAASVGVSRQRVSQLSKRDDFPRPLVVLAAGPVWERHAVENFIEAWERRPGRPRRLDV